MEKRPNKAEMARLRNQAAKMIIVDGMLQKDVAVKIGVSKKTVNDWAKKYKWNEGKQKKDAAMQTTHYLNIPDFEAYLRSINVDMHQAFKTQLAGYLRANKPVQRVLLG